MNELERTEDALLGGRLRFFQPARGYRVAIDPVLLAAAVPVRPGERVLDAGIGSGAAALCLLAREPGCSVTGIERHPELAALAAANAAANGMAERLQVVEADLLGPPGEVFDHVMTNPPYHPGAASSASPMDTKRAAHLAEADLDIWLGACLARLRPKGSLVLIHRADQLDAILAGLWRRAGSVTIFPLWPNGAAKMARRVIVVARRSSRSPARLCRGLVLHAPDGRFTDEAEAVLRHGAALPIPA